MKRLLGGLVAAALLAAAPAAAEPVALLDAPSAEDVALSGDEVVVGRASRRGGARVLAIPRAGGVARRLLTVPTPGGGHTPDVQVAAAEGVVAALVVLVRRRDLEFRLYSGPPAGPLVLRSHTRFSGRGWLPTDVDADGDRVLVSDVRFKPLGTRARLLPPAGVADVVPWSGTVFSAVMAGDRIAFNGSRGSGARARTDRVFVIDRRTGAIETEIDLRSKEDVDEDGVDLAPDGRVAVTTDGTLITAAPGAAPVRRPGAFTLPRFSGGGLVAMREGRFDTVTPVVLDGAAPPRALGGPSADADTIAADDRGAAWIANGCVLYAARDAAPPAGPPAGPCPRAEVVLEEGDQTLRGRRLRVFVTCVAAPAAGCEGTALLGRGLFGRARFSVPPGTRRRVDVRLTGTGMRLVRRWFAKTHEGPDMALSANVRDGRAHGVNGIVVARVRG